MTKKLCKILTGYTFLLSLFLLLPLLLSETAVARQWQSPLLQSHPLSGQIYRLKDAQQLSYHQLLTELASPRFILIGEKHDNPDHHQLELELLQELQQGTETRVVLEMLNRKQAQGYDKLEPEWDDQTLRNALSWPDKGWPWNDYAGLIKAALKDNNELRGGNIERPLLMQIYRGQPPTEARFNTTKNIPAHIREAIQQQVYESHCQTIPKEQMVPMAKVQINRDASMAWQISEQLQPDQQAILFAGSFHTRRDTGVIQHLSIERQTKAAILVLHEVEKDAVRLADYPSATTDIADYIWFTPKFSDQDYCASLRKGQAHKKD